jgi:hypothetical protein
MNFTEKMNQEKLNESMEEKFGTTYQFKVKVQFAGWENAELTGNVISHESDRKVLEAYVEQRLKKEFSNVISYEILELERAEKQIFPMY